MEKYSDNDIKLMYERNFDMLYRIAYTYFKGDKGLIEDSIQDIFLKVFDKNIRFKNLENEKAWFIVALSNHAKNILKKKWNSEIQLDFEVANNDKDNNLIELVMNLPEIYKAPIYLFYYEGYSCKDIGRILNAPENTVYSYLNRGRKILKLELEEENE